MLAAMSQTSPRKRPIGKVKSSADVSNANVEMTLMAAITRPAQASGRGSRRRMRPGTAMPGLDADERAQLRELLERLAVRHGLATGVHPGYRPPAARL
jgi:hypothetical protein